MWKKSRIFKKILENKKKSNKGQLSFPDIKT